MDSATGHAKMKDSGVQWLGKYPSHWKLGKVKNTFFSTKTIVGDQVDNYERLALTMNGVIKRSKTAAGGLQPEKFETYQILEENELVFKLIDLQNVATSRVGRSPYTGIVSPAYIILHERNNQSTRYAEYYFLSMWMHQVFNQLGADGVRSNIGTSALLDIPFLIPPECEQEAIVGYLDAECTKIDQLVVEVKASIEEYKQWKTAIIHNSVTHGLDKNAPRKHSGYERIGAVPSHWNVRKMKTHIENVSSGLSAITSDASSDESGMYVLRTSAVSTGVFKAEEVKAVLNNAVDRLICPVERDTLVMSRMNTASMVGYCAYIADDYPNYYLPDKLWKIHTKDTLMAKYAWFLINAPVSHDWFASVATGTSLSMLNISLSDFYNLIVAVPPIDEQKEICEYLEERCGKIDACISEKQTLISDLESYKKSLIYEVVTGKRKVV